MGIGAATPVLLSAIGVNKNGKRTALNYLFNDLFGAIIWGSAFYITNAFFSFDFMNLTMEPVSIAMLNSAFRIATVAVLMPCVPLLEKLVFFLIRDMDGKHAPSLVDRLDERLTEHPAVAIAQCREALNDMAYKAKQNIASAFELLYNYSESGYSELQEKEKEVDHYEDKLGTYLVKLTGRAYPSPDPGISKSCIPSAILNGSATTRSTFQKSQKRFSIKRWSFPVRPSGRFK